MLRVFDELDCSPEFNRLNIQPVEYVDKNGAAHIQVVMTKDGFMFLGTGFTRQGGPVHQTRTHRMWREAMTEHIKPSRHNLSQRGQKLNAKEGFRKAFRHSFRYAFPKGYFAALVPVATDRERDALRARLLVENRIVTFR
jgi:hypothetical protein